MWKKIKNWLHTDQTNKGVATKPTPITIAQTQHPITRENIHSNALKVLHRLHHARFAAYLVGGSVRDLLIGLKPKDFDVATDASPEQVQQLFRNCRLIGRRFRLAHVYFQDGIVEVATFRASIDNKAKAQQRNSHGMIVQDNIYGTLEEDAWRRDFTVNALYYNIADSSLVDHVDGIKDIEQRVIRMIGDPMQRYQEDPVRMLRAVRLAVKLNFTLEPETEKPIFQLGELLHNIPPARLTEEVIKIYKGGKVHDTFKLLQHYGLFAILFPQTAACLTDTTGPIAKQLLDIAFNNADARLAEQKFLNSAFLFATLLWPPLQKLLQENLAKGYKLYPALHAAMPKVIRQQGQIISLSRQLANTMIDIWVLQYRLAHRTNKWVYRTFQHPRFRAGYDFLTLRMQAGENVAELAAWWAQFQEANEAERQTLIATLQPSSKAPKRRRRKPKKDG